MEQFKNSGWPLVIVVFLMLALSTGVAFSCTTHKNSREMVADTTGISNQATLDQSKLEEASFTDLSANMLQRAINGETIEQHMKILKNINPDTLDDALDTPSKRLTFWINIYNGFTQYFLKTDPSLYKKDRHAYFNKDQIQIAGYTVSFDDIEHGVLRKGATIWSKGYVRIKLFRKDFIKQFAVETVDFRIHFALNCGAKSCPPIVIYREKNVSRQLDDNTKYYLNKVVTYDKEKNVVKVPAFMNWFSADFGGSDKEKRQILKEYNVIPQNADPKVEYLPYDWTPKIENYKTYK